MGASFFADLDPAFKNPDQDPSIFFALNYAKSTNKSRYTYLKKQNKKHFTQQTFYILYL